MLQIMYIVTNFPGDIHHIAGIFTTAGKAIHFVKTHISGYCEISLLSVDLTDDELFNGISRDQPHNSEDYPLRFIDGCPMTNGEASPIRRKNVSEDQNIY